MENSFYRRCTIWISPTLYGPLSLVISRLPFIRRKWVVLLPRKLKNPDVGRGEVACLACLDDEVELIGTFWFVGTLKIVTEKYKRKLRKGKLNQIQKWTPHCPGSASISCYTVEGLKTSFFKCRHNCLIESDKYFPFLVIWVHNSKSQYSHSLAFNRLEFSFKFQVLLNLTLRANAFLSEQK